ncbi:YodC family protein [Achromobacter sp. K91]|uniref:YodC family protein n=1 Tax=Achromobacter sp. K91 TaxID=2292262 RepID=UPI0018F73E3E|nr:DUF2158 domain-containing protein [Achromobacter sp. K91]
MFQQGDVVQLKSGGPLMTVTSISGNDVSCTWFDEKNKVNTRSFPAAILEKYDANAAYGIA